MLKRTLLAAAFLLAAAPALADAPTAKAGTYAIDPRHTQIVFEIRHMGLSTFYGRFGAVSGTLVFDPAAPGKSTLTATVDMTDIQTHVDELDRELRDHVFKAAQYPTATFTATDIVKTGDNTGTVTGNLALAGVTRPVTLNVTFNGGRYPPIPFQPYRLGFDATGTIKRSDFGLTGMIWSGMVSDDVTLEIECELEKQ
ncbi:MAG TPA: YceI family protein [Rhizomicrobium sp.]|nr:YceI family protein [Rhizomicrobium sp.]